MAEPTTLQILQGQALGPFALGASIHDILSRIKSLPLVYPNISLSYSQSHPVNTPLVITLPHNGIRLRFDGPCQRLRLVEVLDFGKSQLSYKGHDISKPLGGNATDFGLHAADDATGPTFRQVYKIFGPTTPGEYMAPKKEGDDKGTYVLSYPGIAFSFPLQSNAWNASHTWSSTVSLLSSTATGPSTSLSVFPGESWDTARATLFTTDMSAFLRSPVPPGLRKEHVPREIESARICKHGRIELVRRDAASFWIVLGETTPQDMVTELGPPDSIHRKNDRRVSIHRARKNSSAGNSRRGSSNSDITPPGTGRGRARFMDLEQSSQGDESSDSEGEDGQDEVENGMKRDDGSEQVFYNYYSHGFDVLVSYPTAASSASSAAAATTPGQGPSTPPAANENSRKSDSPDSDQNDVSTTVAAAATTVVLPRTHLTATKVLFHANVPGSWAFNRHRRLQWTLDGIPSSSPSSRGTKPADQPPLSSEMHWRDIQARLRDAFRGHYASDEEERVAALPMVVNRGWGREELGMEADWGVVGGWEDGAGPRKTLGGKGDGVDGDGAATAATATTTVVTGEKPKDARTTGEGESEQEKMGGAEVYGFPGLVFEVLKNGAVSCLMVY